MFVKKYFLWFYFILFSFLFLKFEIAYSVDTNAIEVDRSFFKAVIKNLQKECNQNKVNSCKSLIRFYDMYKNYEKAFKLAKKTCSISKYKECEYLASFYINGKGTKKNCKKGIYWYKKSCQKNNLSACANLGVLYLIGKCTSKNKKKAVYYFKKSCPYPENSYGDFYGCYYLGLFYEAKKDNKKALKAYSYSCFYSKGEVKEACFRGGRINEKNLNLEGATNFYKEGCDISKGYIVYRGKRIPHSLCEECCFKVGQFYEKGVVDLTKNYSEAAKYYQYACDLGHGKSCLRLAEFYSKGMGVPKDVKKALRLYKESCSNGVSRACYLISLMFYTGLNVKKDINLSFTYALKACEKKYLDGCILVDKMIDERIKNGNYNKKVPMKDVLKFKVMIWVLLCESGKKEYCKKIDKSYIKLFNKNKKDERKIIEEIKNIYKNYKEKEEI